MPLTPEDLLTRAYQPPSARVIRHACSHHLRGRVLFHDRRECIPSGCEFWSVRTKSAGKREAGGCAASSHIEADFICRVQDSKSMCSYSMGELAFFPKPCVYPVNQNTHEQCRFTLWASTIRSSRSTRSGEHLSNLCWTVHDEHGFLGADLSSWSKTRVFSLVHPCSRGSIQCDLCTWRPASK